MFKRGYFFAGLSVAALVVACGSSDSGTSSAPDFNALETELTVPSGTMAAGEEAAVGDGLSAQTEQQQGNPFGGIGGSSIKPKATCGEGMGSDGNTAGSCDCPGGGSITFDLSGMSSMQGDSSGNVDGTVSYEASSCSMEGQTWDGSVYFKIKGNTKDAQNLFFLYSVHLSISGTKTARYDVDYMYKNGKVIFAVDVKDGKVLVSAKGSWDKNTKTGSFTVTDKNTTWECEATNGVGSCTNTAGEKREFGK